MKCYTVIIITEKQHLFSTVFFFRERIIIINTAAIPSICFISLSFFLGITCTFPSISAPLDAKGFFSFFLKAVKSVEDGIVYSLSVLQRKRRNCYSTASRVSRHLVWWPLRCVKNIVKKTTCILQHQVVPSLYTPQQVSSIVPSGKESTKGVYYPYILRANIIIQPSIF